MPWNQWAVGLLADDIVILNPPVRLSPDKALEFAAYVVALAEPMTPNKFATVLERVKKEA